MNPLIPHFSSECLNTIDKNLISWPTISEKDLIEEKIIFVVQINGKKRGILSIKRDMIKNDVLKEVKNNQEIGKLFKNHEVKKLIFVPNRLINIII